MTVARTHETSADAPTAPATARRRAVPGFVWLASLAVLALSLLGTVLLPFLIIPDEKHHADMVLMVQEGDWLEEGWPGIGERRLDPGIVDASLSLGPREEALRRNRAAQHPPLYYVGAALTSYTVTFFVDDPDLSLRLWSYRVFSVLVSALLPVTFYLIAAEVSASRWVRLACSLVPLAVPGITLRNGPMVNNDSLLILLTSLSVLYGVRLAKGDLSKGNSLRLGLATGLAALTKGNALIVVPVIVVAYGIRRYRTRRFSREWLSSVAISGGITLVVGGWWWIRNLFVYGEVQPIRDLTPDQRPDLDWLEWFTTAVDRIVASFWGGQFALGGNRYIFLFWGLTAILVVASIVGWVKSQSRTASSISALYALLLVPAVFTTSALLYVERGRVSGVHGRYFFPGLAGVAPLVVLAMAVPLRRARRWLPTVLVLASAGMTWLALSYMFRRYWDAHGEGLAGRWEAAITSSPIPEAAAVGLLILVVGAFTALLVAAVWVGARRASPQREPLNETPSTAGGKPPAVGPSDS